MGRILRQIYLDNGKQFVAKIFKAEMKVMRREPDERVYHVSSKPGLSVHIEVHYNPDKISDSAYARLMLDEVEMAASRVRMELKSLGSMNKT